MARTKQAPEVTSDENFRRELRSRQGYYDLMSQLALAKHSGIPQSTLSKRLAKPDNFTVEELRKLVGSIKPDPAVMLDFLGYAPKDIRKMMEVR